MKNGIFTVKGQKIYYKNGQPYHAGVVKIDGDIYYISRHGKVVTGQHIVHGEMTNGILKRGTYTFSEEGKLIEGSYIAPKTKKRRYSTHKKHSNKKSLWRRIDKKTFALCSGLIAFLILLIVLGVILDSDKKSQVQITDAPVEFALEMHKETFSLSSAVAQKLYLGECDFEDVTGDNPYRAFVLDYTLEGTNGEFTLSEYPDMRNRKSYILSRYEDKLTIDNLKTDTVYYYEAVAGDEKLTGSFSTAEGRRYVNIPGVVNTRDIGGYKTADGKTVKQGMIIRGSELDGFVEAECYLSNMDAEVVMEQFGFNYEMDLRDSSVVGDNYTSRLSSEVVHDTYNAPMYGSIFSSKYKTALKNIFSDLAKEENYPMYMHCTKGADRTGTIVFLLQGILGVDSEDILDEYRLTSFVSSTFARSGKVSAITDGLEKYDGDTLSEKITDFLITDIGVTQSEIDSIRNILLEE